MADTNLWMLQPEFKWLKDYLEKLRENAVNELLDGTSMEGYAELRGYIRALDAVTKAPEKYIQEVRKRQESENA